MQSLTRHFRPHSPTDIEKIQTQWAKEQAVSGIQQMMLEMPTDTPKDRLVWIKFFETWARMTGAFVPETLTQTTNNILVIPQEQNDELWPKRVKSEQERAFASAASEMATHTGSASASS